MLLTDIRQAVTDRWPDTLITATLDRFIAAAVREYARWNPLRATTTLTTVSGTARYTLPVGSLGMVALEEATDYTVALDDPDLVSKRLWSQRVIDDIEDMQWSTSYGTGWEVEGTELVLKPTPSGVTVYTLYYYAPYALANGAYAIPDEDLELVAGLVRADLLEKGAEGYALEPDYSEGLEKQTFSKIPDLATLQAERLRQRVSAKYGGPVVAGVP